MYDRRDEHDVETVQVVLFFLIFGVLALQLKRDQRIHSGFDLLAFMELIVTFL